ncbi:MAG: FecR domain-containing protein [Anaerolineae bacterium]
MRSNPERVAWVVLLSSFGIFCALVISIPLGLRWYLFNTTLAFSTNVTSLRGTVLTREANNDPTLPITGGQTQEVEEDVTVTTDDTSQAILTFFDQSSITLYSNTAVTIRQTRTPRFNISPKPDLIIVDIEHGRIRATPAAGDQPRHFVVRFPQGQTQLSPGSFSLEVNENLTQIAARQGEALVIGNGGNLQLPEGRRVLVSKGGNPSDPLPLELNLLAAASFDEGAARSWEPYTFTQTDAVTPTVKIIDLGNRPILELFSEGEDGFHTEAGVRQDVNRDVRDFQSLRIQADIRLVRQSLPGGGQLGSEFPVMIHLAYKDADGNDRDWFHGFYYEPPPENYLLINQHDNSNERVARFLWYPYESQNLLASLDGPAKPVFIKYLRIYASGWIYHTMVANVELLAQE